MSDNKTKIMNLAMIHIQLTAAFIGTWAKCPVTVFLTSGIFPLVPGAGIFWTSYNIVSNDLYATL